MRRTVDVQPVERPDKLSKGEFLAPEHSQTDIVHSGPPTGTMAPKACSVSKSMPVWKCKGPSMFNLSRFAASKREQLGASPKNIRRGKKTPDEVYTNYHPDKIDNDKIWYCSNSRGKGSDNFQDTPFVLQCHVRDPPLSW